MPNKRQAFIWTNDGLFHWRIYVSLGLNELKQGWGLPKTMNEWCMDQVGLSVTTWALIQLKTSSYQYRKSTMEFTILVRWYLFIESGPWQSVVQRATAGPGAHFTNNFSITIQMWWKFHFAPIQILIKWSLQYLAHGTTAGLSWHVPNFVAIWSSVIELELSEISIEFELWWKNR